MNEGIRFSFFRVSAYLSVVGRKAGNNVDELYRFHIANNVEVVEEPRNQPYGLREYTVRDLDGYFLTFGYRLHCDAA